MSGFGEKILIAGRKFMWKSKQSEKEAVVTYGESRFRCAIIILLCSLKNTAFMLVGFTGLVISWWISDPDMFQGATFSEIIGSPSLLTIIQLFFVVALTVHILTRWPLSLDKVRKREAKRRLVRLKIRRFLIKWANKPINIRFYKVSIILLVYSSLLLAGLPKKSWVGFSLEVTSSMTLGVIGALIIHYVLRAYKSYIVEKVDHIPELSIGRLGEGSR